MHDFSPLCPLELRAIEENLNAGNLEQAQRQLGLLAPHTDLEPGTAYLATRLLFLRGRLDAARVVERMRELIGAHPTFTEARQFMDYCQTLLGSDTRSPAPAVTPRPRSLFPSAPPKPKTPAPTLSAPPDKPTAESVGDELGASSTSVEVEETELFDSDRPTFEPGLGQLQADRASTAPTEFPAGLGPTVNPIPTNLDRSSREIRVDTRQSFYPSSASLPPPSGYNPGIPRPVGRYSQRGRHERLPDDVVSSVQPSERPPTAGRAHEAKPNESAFEAEHSGRYRLSNISSDVIPIPLVAGKVLPRSAGVEVRRDLPTSAPPAFSSRDAPHADERPAPFRVPRPDVQEGSADGDEPSHEWKDPDRQFIHDPRSARTRFEKRALSLLEPYPSGFEAFDERAAELSMLLSSAPVVHYFAPFDRSLCSLSRLELALRTLYGATGALPSTAIRNLVALYLGDVLRTSHRGTWRGTPDRPSTWAVEAGAHIWQPFRYSVGAFHGDPGHSLLASLGPGLARRGTVAWMSRTLAQIPLPKPWFDPLTPQKQTELGQWVKKSPWSVCCEQLFGHPLDGSAPSLKALDQLLDVLFDSGEAPRALDPSLARAATLAGAYVGVVLGVGRTATWVERDAQNGERYLGVELPGGLLATPIVNIIARATSRKRSQLSDYVRALLRRAH